MRKYGTPSFPFKSVFLAVLVCLPFAGAQLRGQALPPDRQPEVGDAPATALPLAKDISPAFTHTAVRRAMRKVGDWQLNRAEKGFSQDWTFAALYAGFMAVPDEAGGQRYRQAMMRMGRKFNWQPGPRVEHADDQAIGQTYLELYLRTHNRNMLTPMRDRMDAEMRLPEQAGKPLWWWCDALFMAPPVLARLAKITGDRQYLDFMDHEWWITSDLLYNPEAHLFSRDATYLGKHEANGQGLFWSRGNGWVMAGLARVLAQMPRNYPTRPRYITQFRQMAAKIASIQGQDGLWRPGLLDAAAYPLPENSGSAFFVYAIAYGINAGILDRARYLPVVQKGWAGLIAHIDQDGRIGCIQPVGAAPDAYTATSSYVFGTGAFLLAGSEVDRLAR